MMMMMMIACVMIMMLYDETTDHDGHFGRSLMYEVLLTIATSPL